MFTARLYLNVRMSVSSGPMTPGGGGGGGGDGKCNIVIILYLYTQIKGQKQCRNLRCAQFYLYSEHVNEYE